MSWDHPRALERFDFELPALVETTDSEQQKTCCYPVTRDISCAGGYFHTKNPLAEKTRIKIGLLFELNKSESDSGKSHFFLEFTGQVVRAEEQGMAVRFDQDYHHVPITKL